MTSNDIYTYKQYLTKYFITWGLCIIFVLLHIEKVFSVTPFSNILFYEYITTYDYGFAQKLLIKALVQFLFLKWGFWQWVSCITKSAIRIISPTIGKILGLYSLSGRMSYRKMSRSLEVTSSELDFSSRPKIWLAPRQHRSRAACHILERYDKDNIRSHVFETSRDWG